MPTTTAKFLAPTASLGPLLMFPPPSTVRDQSTPSAVRDQDTLPSAVKDQGTPSLWRESRAPPLQWGTKVAPSAVGDEGTPPHMLWLETRAFSFMMAHRRPGLSNHLGEDSQK